MLTQELGGDFEPFKCVPDAKGAQGGDFASVTWENTLARLVVQEVRQGTKSAFGKGQLRALSMLSGKISEVGRGNEVHRELGPSGPSIKLAGILGPR